MTLPEQLDIPANLNRSLAIDLLADPETQAFACLVAAAALLGEDALVDMDGQVYGEEELRAMLEQENAVPHEETITRITGLLFAASGDEFNEDPDHFHRMCSAIADGDPFGQEDDGDPLTIPDIYWAIYQVGLVTDEREPVEELGPRVARFLEKLMDDEAEDVEALQEEVDRLGGSAEDMEPYYKRLLVFRRGQLAADLVRLGCEPDWMTPVEPELAGMMAAFKE